MHKVVSPPLGLSASLIRTIRTSHDLLSIKSLLKLYANEKSVFCDNAVVSAAAAAVHSLLPVHTLSTPSGRVLSILYSLSTPCPHPQVVCCPKPEGKDFAEWGDCAARDFKGGRNYTEAFLKVG